jgi:signal transduction histidine kinase
MSGDSAAEVLAMAAHELRGPLTAVHGYAQLILRIADEESASQRIVRAAEMILMQAARGSRLIGGLLEAGRTESLRPQLRRRRVNLVELLVRVVAEQQRVSEHHVLRLEAPGRSLHAEVDGDLIEQALLNLIGNAIKYSPDGGEVLVQLVRAGAGRAAISVTDNGIGIAPEEQALVFERFYRSQNSAARAAGGMGLGLYLCRRIAAEHNGDLTLWSAPHQGSTFTLALPLR